MRAGLIYQHASREADQAIADRLSALVNDFHNGAKTQDGDAIDRQDEDDDGTDEVLAPTG